MFKIPNTIYRYGFLLLLLTVFTALPIQSAFAQFVCVPSCDITDARFMVLSGSGVRTTNNTDAFFHIVSTGGNANFEIGIFDGDAQTSWDIDGFAPFTELEFTLFFDPDGNGLGIGNGVVYDTWSSDGSFGDNTGNPMPDNDWFDINLPNDPQAQTAVGSFSYVLRAVNLNPAVATTNNFKVRTDGIVSIPAGEVFNYTAHFRTFADIAVVYPNWPILDPADINNFPDCFNSEPGGFGSRLTCDPADPNCCLNPTNYDGLFEFIFNVPDQLTTLDIWDGDLDHGSQVSPGPECVLPLAVDTDDPNTPIPLPPWAIGSDAVTQGISNPTEPEDDNCAYPFNRTPSIVYELISPDGTVYLNDNPSGDREWELFNMSTNPPDPALYDINVDNIPGGQWIIRTIGVNIANLNSMRVPFAVCGLDPQGNITCPTVVLDVVIEGNGDGRVDSTDPGIVCSSTGDDNCHEVYDLDTLVTLTATPEPLSYFAGWSGDPACTGDPLNPVLNLQMDMDISCIATFEPFLLLDVTIEGNGDGRVDSDIAGIVCSNTGDDDCDELYDINTLVTLTATPDDNSFFVGWSGDPVCIGPDPTDPILNLQMTMDISCIATFQLIEFVLNPIFPALDDNINFLSAENATPNGNVAFTWGKVPGSFIVGGRICNGIELGIANLRLLTIERANEFGVATYIFYIPLFSDLEFSIQLQAVDIETCRVSNQIEQIIRKDEDGGQGPR